MKQVTERWNVAGMDVLLNLHLNRDLQSLLVVPVRYLAVSDKSKSSFEVNEHEVSLHGPSELREKKILGSR